jgi:hypothetical protein
VATLGAFAPWENVRRVDCYTWLVNSDMILHYTPVGLRLRSNLVGHISPATYIITLPTQIGAWDSVVVKALRY